MPTRGFYFSDALSSNGLNGLPNDIHTPAPMVNVARAVQIICLKKKMEMSKFFNDVLAHHFDP